MNIKEGWYFVRANVGLCPQNTLAMLDNETKVLQVENSIEHLSRIPGQTGAIMTTAECRELGSCPLLK